MIIERIAVKIRKKPVLSLKVGRIFFYFFSFIVFIILYYNLFINFLLINILVILKLITAEVQSILFIFASNTKMQKQKKIIYQRYCTK